MGGIGGTNEGGARRMACSIRGGQTRSSCTPLIFGGPDVAEYFGIPMIVGNTLPAICPTSLFPNSYLFGSSLGPWLNRQSYKLIPLLGRFLGKVRALWRKQRLGLHSEPRSMLSTNSRPTYHLHGYSQYLLPRPPDWPPEYLVTGSWSSERHLPPPSQELIEFFGCGPGPSLCRLRQHGGY